MLTLCKHERLDRCLQLACSRMQPEHCAYHRACHSNLLTTCNLAALAAKIHRHLCQYVDKYIVSSIERCTDENDNLFDLIECADHLAHIFGVSFCYSSEVVRRSLSLFMPFWWRLSFLQQKPILYPEWAKDGRVQRLKAVDFLLQR